MELKFHAGDHIQLHPACDLWMRGLRYGTVVKVGRKYVTVKLHNWSRLVRVRPENLLHDL
jgi:hypothetical protein